VEEKERSDFNPSHYFFAFDFHNILQQLKRSLVFISFHILPPNFWVMKMKERNYERFVELLTPPSDVKLLCYIFQLYEWGVKEFTQKDIYKSKSLCEWSAYYSLYRLQQKGIVKYKYTLPLQSGGRVKVYELNEENEVVQKLLGLFKVVVNGGENV